MRPATLGDAINQVRGQEAYLDSLDRTNNTKHMAANQNQGPKQIVAVQKEPNNQVKAGWGKNRIQLRG